MGKITIEVKINTFGTMKHPRLAADKSFLHAKPCSRKACSRQMLVADNVLLQADIAIIIIHIL